MTSELFGPVCDEIKRRAAESESAPGFLKAIFENRKKYDTEPLAEALYRCLILADLAGRAEVQAEGDDDLNPSPFDGSGAGGEGYVAAFKAEAISFYNLPFEEAVDYLRGLTPMTGAEYYKLEQAARSKAFSISGQSSLDLIKGVKAELMKALEEGKTYSQWRDSIDSVFNRYGVTRLDNSRAELIFRQNTQTAYQVGRYREMKSPAIRAVRPYWVYEAVHDSRTRPAHRAMDGLCFPADHEFWKTHYPPNGFRCRCRVRALSERQLRARGLDVLSKVPDERVDPRTGELIEDLSPDPGFDTNPALSWAA